MVLSLASLLVLIFSCIFLQDERSQIWQVFSNVFFHAFRYVLQLHPTRFGLSPIISNFYSKYPFLNRFQETTSSCFMRWFTYLRTSFFDFLCHQCTLPNPLIALPSIHELHLAYYNGVGALFAIGQTLWYDFLPRSLTLGWWLDYVSANGNWKERKKLAITLFLYFDGLWIVLLQLWKWAS